MCVCFGGVSTAFHCFTVSQSFSCVNTVFRFCRVSQPPQTLDELGESLNLWDKLNADKPTIEAKFEPLSEQFAILEKYEVPIPEDVSVSFAVQILIVNKVLWI